VGVFVDEKQLSKVVLSCCTIWS